LEEELTYHQEWYKKARENYDRDRKFWGQADDGEMRVASDAVSTTSQEIKSLKQILSQSTPLIPELEKAFDEGFHKGYGGYWAICGNATGGFQFSKWVIHLGLDFWSRYCFN